MHDLVITSFFTSKVDPQSGQKITPTYDYMKPWYESMVKLGLHGIVFYDSLPHELLKEYATDKIFFVPVNLGEYSTNDERFIVYEKYFQEDSVYTPKYILLTDIMDVTFIKDPFDFIRLYGFPLYFGDDSGRLFEGSWLYQKALRLYGNVNIIQEPVVNAGVIGGLYKNVIKLIHQVVEEIKQVGHRDNSNMLALNKTLSQRYDKFDYWRGVPFTNKFKTFVNVDDVSIMHK